jgi:cob(I)alamin adenosyltransferase
MKIYTKTGDKGMTGLYGGTRVSKSNLRIDSYGTVDELNSYLGLIRDQKVDNHTFESIIEIQKNLFVAGAVLATPADKEILKNGKKRLAETKVSEEMISFLETEIDIIDAELPVMTHFVLPGGHPVVSYCHVARSVCRRAERLVVQLAEQEEIGENVIQYLNRLSDYLFVLARKLTFENNAEEFKWIP